MEDALDTHTVSGSSCAWPKMRDGRDVAYYVEPVPFLGLLRRQRLKAQLHVYLGEDIVCTPGGVLERQSGSCEVVRGDAAIISDNYTRDGSRDEGDAYHPRNRTLSPIDWLGRSEREHSEDGTGPLDIASRRPRGCHQKTIIDSAAYSMSS